MLISVIIPHFNQPQYLDVCLDNLHRQINYKSDVEILVVDNASKHFPEDVCSNFPGVKLHLENTPGPGPARNLGAKHAKGDILAFIDADCHADHNWLSAIETAFETSATQVIGGDVQVKYATPGYPTFLEPYESIYSYRNNEHIAEGFSGTGNLAMRSEVFKKVGLFAGLGVAEDRDWGLRAKELGYGATYIENMIVFHPARRSFAELTGKWDRHIIHDYLDYSKAPLGKTRWLLRAIAIAGSPAGELGTVLSSKRVEGVQERALAFICLSRIRLYRARKMLQVLVTPKSLHVEGDWGR